MKAETCQQTCPGLRRRRQETTTACQASTEQHSLTRRTVLNAGIAAAAAAGIQLPTPADALVVSKEWEKVARPLCLLLLVEASPVHAMTATSVSQVALPLDPGVVLLDIAFTGSNPDHGMQQT